jgi:hypothetical protein
MVLNVELCICSFGFNAPMFADEKELTDLQGGKTSTFDLYGKGQQYKLADFTEAGEYTTPFREVAARLKLPIKIVHLPQRRPCTPGVGARCRPSQT